MRLDEFDYELPVERIAQYPLADRSASRLMIVDRASGAFDHGHFRDIVDQFDRGDVIVMNRSRVIPARLFLERPSGGRAELLVTTIEDERRFRAIGSPLRKLHPGETFSGADGSFEVRVIERIDEREVRVEAVSPPAVLDLVNTFGHMPLPPYIDRGDEAGDRERYQTVIAREPGSVAAPTAGLHFDNAMLDALRAKGVKVLTVVLHVGLGTFLPLDSGVVEENRLHEEAFSVDDAVVNAIRRARRDGGRVTAVGTTTTRVLETLHTRGLLDTDADGRLDGSTDTFIYPPYRFGAVDGLITNFHLPKSSLLLLVSAFLGRDKTLACYRAAVDAGYRFFSYGDAMFIR